MAVLPELLGAEVQHTAYPLDRCYPVDSKPIMGFVTASQCRVYVAVMHSGVTLAPVMSGLAAREIVSGEDCPEFEPYRITRNFGDWTHKY